MNKLWFILPLMIGCNSPELGATDASVDNSNVSVSDTNGSGSNNVGLDATVQLSQLQTPAPAAGVSCSMPVAGPKYHPGAAQRFRHRRHHHACP